MTQPPADALASLIDSLVEGAVARAVGKLMATYSHGTAVDAMGDRLLKVKEVALIVGLSQRSVRELIARGEIPTRDVEPYNCILVARSDLEQWIASLPTRRAGHE